MPVDLCAVPPAHAADLSFLSDIVAMEGDAVVDLLLERQSDRIAAASPSLAAFYRQLPARGTAAFPEYWSASFGGVKAVLANGATDASFALVQGAIGLTSALDDVPWDVTLSAPARFVVGASLTPVLDRIVCDGNCRLSGWMGGKEVRLARFDGDWVVEPSARSESFGALESGGRRLLVAPTAAHAALHFEYSSIMQPSRASPAKQLAALIEGWDYLSLVAPRHRDWVGAVARTIVPLHADRMIYSQSSVDSPGTLAMSVPSRRSAIAEMLIHESSHQYFHIAEMLGPVAEPSDRLYFSPVKGTGRPIGRILLAYHAFVNVGMMYRAALDMGLDEGGYCRQSLDRHRPELEIMRDHLLKTDLLTDIGRQLAEPLHDAFEDVAALARV